MHAQRNTVGYKAIHDEAAKQASRNANPPKAHVILGGVSTPITAVSPSTWTDPPVPAPSAYEIVRDALRENGYDWPVTNALIAVKALRAAGLLP